MKTTKTVRTIVLPKLLKDKIDRLEFTRIQREKAYKICDLILSKQLRDDHGYDSYIDLPQGYLRKLFGGNYHRFFDKLKPDILFAESWVNADGEYKEKYSNMEGSGQSKRYKIQTDLLRCEFDSACYHDKINRGDKGYLWVADERFEKRIVTNDIASLQIKKDALIERAEKYIADISRNNFKINDEISEMRFQVADKITGYKGFTSLRASLERTTQTDSLIKDDRKYFLANLDNYVKKKKDNIRFSYLKSIEMLCNHNCHYANRNPENNRLDHNMTSLSSTLLEVVMDYNNLCEIDMKNSQFALLAWLMANDKEFTPTPDFKIFAEHAAKGSLYEYIKDEFVLPNRNNAKAMMMELAFSGHKNPSPNKSKLRKIFPSIVTYTDEYKRKHGDNAFAIYLQKEEAKLFIDGLYHELKKKGMWVLTRHDSLLVKKESKIFVSEFMYEYFRRVNLECSIKM